MKKILLLAALIFTTGFASAQALENAYKFSNGNVLNITHVRSIGYASGYLVVTANGSPNTTDYPDSGAVIYNKIKARADFTKKFVQIGSTGTYINTQMLDSVRCSGSQSNLLWTFSGSEGINDGCAFHTAVKTASN
jgi:hypothetical protein